MTRATKTKTKTRLRPIAEYCKACKGLCCKRYAFIELDYKDIMRMSHYLEISITEFKQRFVFTGRLYYYSMVGKPCPFHSEMGCTIYKARPETCHKYPLFFNYSQDAFYIHNTRWCLFRHDMVKIFEQSLSHINDYVINKPVKNEIKR
jgi:uncharacterized protein